MFRECYYTIVNCPGSTYELSRELKDSNTTWDAGVIADQLSPFVNKYEIDTVSFAATYPNLQFPRFLSNVCSNRL